MRSFPARWLRAGPAALLLAVAMFTAGNTQAGPRRIGEPFHWGGEIAPGKTLALAFTVKPEVFVRSRNLEPMVTATCGDLEVTVAAVPLKAKDRFSASLTLPQAGVWRIRVDSRYCETVMDPLSVTASPAEGRSS